MKRKIVIVEDHPLFREQLAMLINKQPDMEVCGETDNFQTAMEIIRTVKPDAAVVDITLKGSNGLEVLKELKAQSVELPVLVLSMHDESLYAERVIRAGAQGYITKNESAEKLVAAIRKVAGGDVYLSDGMTARLLKNISDGKKPDGTLTLASLADRELEVFQLIGKGKTTREIAEMLKLEPTTVDTYRARIKEKLNLKNATQLVHLATDWVHNQV